MSFKSQPGWLYTVIAVIAAIAIGIPLGNWVAENYPNEPGGGCQKTVTVPIEPGQTILIIGPKC